MSEPTSQQTFDSALRHHQAGQLAQAEQLYQNVLIQQPEHAVALHCLGVINLQTGRHDAAVDLIRRAVSLQPDFAEAHCNLGNALVAKGQFDDAIASLRRTTSLDAKSAQAIITNASSASADLDLAIAAFRQAISLNPKSHVAWNNLGNALKVKSRFEEAFASLRQVAFPTDDNLLDQAIDAYRQAIALQPTYISAFNNLGVALKEQGRLQEAIDLSRRMIALRPGDEKAHSNLLFMLNYDPASTSQTIRDACRRWNTLYAAPLNKFIQPLPNNRDPNRRLRIGYVSPDFREHVVARNLFPLLSRHNHAEMEIVFYSNVFKPDGFTEQLRQFADGWRDILHLSDAQAADLIRRDQIDILVDLALHTPGNRLTLFAHKPAPIQVTFAGYPGSTGLDTIDYRLTDPYLDPPESSDQFYSEKSYRLPHTFWCYQPFVAEIPVNPLPAESNGFITFGCQNNFYKVNPRVLQLWAQVLKAVPRSRLLLLAPEGSPRQRVRDQLRNEGVDPATVEFVSRRFHAQYLRTYNRIDIGLDTFPYNGHTTSLDASWMGTPMITLVGQTVVGRAGLSQLTNLGLQELIAHTPLQFVRTAASLANDFPRLAELRSTLRARMIASPLMNAEAYAKGVEAAFRDIWQRY